MSQEEKVEVSAEVAKVIAQLWARGVPSAPRIILRRATWSGMAVAIERVELEHSELALTVQAEGDDAIGPDSEEGALQARGSGWALEAEYARATDWNLANGTTILRCAQWKASSRRRSARYWACETACALPPMPGNLALVLTRGKRRSITRSMHLRGRYHYYFLRLDGQRVRLLIDVGPPAQIDFLALRADFLALQFALGTGFNTTLLTGLDDKGRPVALANYMLGSPATGPRVEWPVPSAHQRETWSVPFCERICEVDTARPELRLRIPLSFYVASLYAPVLELKYLLLQVATEATAHWYLKSRGEEEVEIVDQAKWRAWTKLNAEAVKDLAHPGMAELLLLNVKNARRHASGRHIAKAFGFLEIALPAEILEEVSEGRGAMIHQATMFEEPQNAAEPYVTRVAIVRTALVALLARIVGYDGPIAGWTSRPRHAYEQAGRDWWPHVGAVDGASARRDYICEGRLPKRS